MSKAPEIVINCSEGHYNLGALKLAAWRRASGIDVHYFDGDPGLLAPANVSKVWLSCVFSWHAPVAADIAWRFKFTEIEVGGPGLFALQGWWKLQTGLDYRPGLDQRFERAPGSYEMVFASRGCPVGCWFCIVPKLEGKGFQLDYDFTPAPMLCDNNLSGLPVDFQAHIIRRYIETGTVLKDANSGFEPASFDEATYRMWKPILKGPWRFAFDVVGEEPAVKRMMEILADAPASRKRVYVLIGNEPMEQCLYRAKRVIEWGGEPYCQPVMALNALSREDIMVRYDWSRQALKDVARYYNRWIWRSVTLEDYEPRNGEKFKSLMTK